MNQFHGIKPPIHELNTMYFNNTVKDTQFETKFYRYESYQFMN